MWVCECACACVYVSDPRFIQFALGSCYAVHINALSISGYMGCRALWEIVVSAE